MWREGTIGLAQATFQDWLNQVVQQLSLTRPSVNVAAQDESVVEKNATALTETNYSRDIWRVSARVGFDFSEKVLYAFLERLAGHDKQIVVESLIVRGGSIPKVEMVLVAYFQKPSNAEKPTSATAVK